MSKQFLYSWLIVMIVAQIVGGYLIGSTWVQYATGIFSVIYVFLVTLASKWNFVAGAILASVFVVIAYESHVYGDMLYQGITLIFNLVATVLYVVIGRKEPMRMRLFSTKEKLGIAVGYLIMLCALIPTLDVLGDPMPIRDALVFSIGVTAVYALARGYKYNFAFWIASNTVQIVLWVSTASYSEHGLAMAINYAVFLGNSIIGLINWVKMSKEVKTYEHFPHHSMVEVKNNLS